MYGVQPLPVVHFWIFCTEDGLRAGSSPSNNGEHEVQKSGGRRMEDGVECSYYIVRRVAGREPESANH
jgi:hypothetical protein